MSIIFCVALFFAFIVTGKRTMALSTARASAARCTANFFGTFHQRPNYKENNYKKNNSYNNVLHYQAHRVFISKRL